MVSCSELLTGRSFRVPGKRKRSDLQEKFQKKGEQALEDIQALLAQDKARVASYTTSVAITVILHGHIFHTEPGLSIVSTCLHVPY